MGGSMDSLAGNILTKNLLRLAPGRLHNFIFKIILDKTINRNPGICERLREIEGKAFQLEASDIQKNYSFYVDGGKVRTGLGGKEKPDVVMQGSFHTFLQLFFHKADADSLFFSRRLVIKGDVKTSVFFKNLIEHL